MADKIVTQDPTNPNIFKVNGPVLSPGGKILLSDLDTGGGINGDVLTLVAGVWAPAPTSSLDTASNLGAGAQVFASKVGPDFQFRSIVGGTGITAIQNANDITLSLAGGGAFTSSFVSAQQAIVAAGLLTIAHGLGSTPTLVQCELVNINAEFNFSPGDIVLISNDGQDASFGVGVALVPDAVNLNIRYGSLIQGAGQAFSILNKTTGSPDVITPANWQFRVRAWV